MLEGAGARLVRSRNAGDVTIGVESVSAKSSLVWRLSSSLDCLCLKMSFG